MFYHNKKTCLIKEQKIKKKKQKKPTRNRIVKGHPTDISEIPCFGNCLLI